MRVKQLRYKMILTVHTKLQESSKILDIKIRAPTKQVADAKP
jgi:hypothetical protein